MKIKVDDVYTRNPVTVGPETSAPDARKLMEEHDIRRLPVVQDGKLVGIVTLTDLLRAAPSPATSLSIWELNYLLDKIKVAELMTRDVVTATPDTDLQAVAKIMAERKIGGIPVVEGDKVIGIITDSDVFGGLWKLLEERQAAWPLTGSAPGFCRGPVPGSCRTRGRRAAPARLRDLLPFDGRVH